MSATTDVPKYGYKLKLDHEFKESWNPHFRPKLNQILPYIAFAIREVRFEVMLASRAQINFDRYLIYYIKTTLQGRRVIMDNLFPITSKQIYGVPLGGIGAGTIGRGYKGEFCRYQLRPGIYEYNVVDANQFIVTVRNRHGDTVFQSLLSTYKRKSKNLSSWQSLIDGSKCNYTGLFPRSWTEYDLSEYGVRLVCRQISPVIPDNYKDSSMPASVFVWDVENVSDEELDVTLAFVFKSGTGDAKQDKKSVSSSKTFSHSTTEGVLVKHRIADMDCTYLLATTTSDDVEISKCAYFDPNSDGSSVWDQLYESGRFDRISHKSYGDVTGEIGVGIAVQTKLASRKRGQVEMCLVWDMPEVRFFLGKESWRKYYAKYFGTAGGVVMANYALRNYRTWEEEIYKWQADVLSGSEYPDWYKDALFNQSYFVSDGGSIWVSLDEVEAHKLPPNDPRLSYGRFAYLEGHEYRMYNTYDVHFYASFAISMNWPRLQEVMQYDYRDAVFREIPDLVTQLVDGVRVERKVKNSVPHDLGDPYEDAFRLINAYNSHDVSNWRDLNTKFVLQVFRDYSANVPSDKERYLADMYEALTVVMEKTEKFDVDGDGLIEHSGNADQTYDSWIMKGSSAYCGGLWLAALYAMTVMADILGKKDDKDKYQALLDKGTASFNRKLWTGSFYRFDSEGERESEVIMADQLCGQWYLNCCGYNYEVFDKEKVLSSLQTIYTNNALRFAGGRLGAVNGFTTSGKVDDSSLQSPEMWVAITYSLSALMLHEGMKEEAWKMSGDMYKTITTRLGLAYDIPEAMYEENHYRSLGYMRALGIWSIQHVINQRKAESK